MENKEIKIVAGDQVQELIIREGQALDPISHVSLRVSGSIGCPLEYVDQRKPNPNESHIIFEREKGQITLIDNEKFENYTEIIGKVLISKHFKDLGLIGASSYSPYELSKKLKRYRRFFTSQQENMTIISALKNFEAKVNKAMDQSKDERGNYKNAVAQTVESNIPDSFILKMPILKGGEDQEFKVEIHFEVSGNSVSIQLESLEAEELIENQTLLIFDEMKEQLSDYPIFEK